MFKVEKILNKRTKYKYRRELLSGVVCHCSIIKDLECKIVIITDIENYDDISHSSFGISQPTKLVMPITAGIQLSLWL